MALSTKQRHLNYMSDLHILFSLFNQALKSLPSGQGQSSEALPSEQPHVTPRLRVVPTTVNQGVTYESI